MGACPQTQTDPSGGVKAAQRPGGLAAPGADGLPSPAGLTGAPQQRLGPGLVHTADVMSTERHNSVPLRSKHLRDKNKLKAQLELPAEPLRGQEVTQALD